MGLYEAYVINALWIDLFSFLHYDVLDSERLSRVKLFLYYVGWDPKDRMAKFRFVFFFLIKACQMLKIGTQLNIVQ